MALENTPPKEGKKKILKRGISKDVVPLNEQTWLLQPVVVTTMRYDYDVTDTRILVAIMEKLQDSLKKLMDNVCSPEQLPLFTNSDFGEDEVGKDEIMLEIPLKDFGSDKRRYSLLKDTLRRLVSIPIETMATDEKGKSYVHFSGLCEAYIEDKPYVNHVKIKLKKKIALRLLDTRTMGVHRYLKDVVFTTRNKYVQRFYMFISAWKQSGIMPLIKVSELRKMLRLEDKYPRWNMFYSKVIKGAMEELKQRAECGETDCYFEVEPVYKKGKSRGEPESLRFIIIKSVAGLEASEVMELKSQRIKLEDFLKTYLQQSRANINTLLAKVNKDNIEEFSTFLSELSGKASGGGDRIKDLRSWAYTSAMRFLSDWEEKREAEAKRQEAVMQTVIPLDNATKAEHSKLPYAPEYATKWEHFISLLQEQLPKQAFDTWIVPLSLYSANETGMVVQVPSRFFCEYLEQNYLTELRMARDASFGQVHFSYRISI